MLYENCGKPPLPRIAVLSAMLYHPYLPENREIFSRGHFEPSHPAGVAREVRHIIDLAIVGDHDPLPVFAQRDKLLVVIFGQDFRNSSANLWSEDGRKYSSSDGRMRKYSSTSSRMMIVR